MYRETSGNVVQAVVRSLPTRIRGHDLNLPTVVRKAERRRKVQAGLHVCGRRKVVSKEKDASHTRLPLPAQYR